MKTVGAVAAILLFLAAPLFAQNTFPPASFKNLQVLPKDSPARVVVATMKGFAINLGVRCQFCHVGKEGLPLEEFDFVSDEIPQKKTARIMMRLTDDINKTLDTAVPRAAETEARVSCMTCHRGKSKPTNVKEP
jgi:Photosynthetic reaction centre cytochrome C subunit